MSARQITGAIQVAINAPWLAIAAVAALLIPIATTLLASHLSLGSRLTLRIIAAVLAIACAVRISIVGNSRPARILGTIVALGAYCFAMSALRTRRELVPPPNAEPDNAMRHSLEGAAGIVPTIYDRAPANLVTVERVQVARESYAQRIHIVLDIIWSKHDGLPRQYRGSISYVGELDGERRVQNLRPNEEAIGPATSWAAYLIGFVEIDLMMTKEHEVLRKQLISAIRTFEQERRSGG